MTDLVIPAFIAGLFMFFAPCTLPLVPGYLAFISGVSVMELQNPETTQRARRTVFMNGVMYVFGFSAVFIVLGMLFGLGGAALVHYRELLARIGGVFIIFFGLYMLRVLRIFALERFLRQEHRLHFTALNPGTPASSFILGATFAFGWSPCVGPILGSVLLLASVSSTIAQGGLLLAIFSLGLAVPFLLLAYAVGSATHVIRRLRGFLKVFSFIGGAFLVLLGALMVTDTFGVFIGWFYGLFSFANYEGALLNFL